MGWAVPAMGPPLRGPDYESAAAAVNPGDAALSVGGTSGARPPAPGAAAVALQLLLERVDDEVHHRHIRLHAVQLQLSVQVLRDTGRELNPDFPFACCHDPSFSARDG